MYLFERLSGEYECEIIPGVSSLMASAAALQRPLAARNDVLTIVPAPLADDVLLERFNSGDAIAIIKIAASRSRSVLVDISGLKLFSYSVKIFLYQQISLKTRSGLVNLKIS